MEALSKLNSAQREAVVNTEGPLMVLAGAGSGKTRTLVTRIAWLIQELEMASHRILALTFSNKAAREMRDRVASEIYAEPGSVQVTTFHSFCARILRSEAQYLGIVGSFVIYDQSESRSVVKNILQRHGIKSKDLNPYDVMYFMDEVKNNGFYPGRDSEEGKIYEKHEFYNFYLEYQSELSRANALDFGGLIVTVLQLFHKYPDVLERYQNRFQYILVDEYQDTNKAQFELICLLAQKNQNICVVGDEDQSIYSWRGADINNILDFEKHFPKAKLVKLEQNYRSSRNIIEAASCVISCNRLRKGKKMWTENPEGDSINIVECPDDKSESLYVAQEVNRLASMSGELSEIAIFYRTNAQSRSIEDCLRRINIPYKVVGGVRFYERKEVKDVLGYLRMVVNPKDSLALARVVNVPARGIGATTLKKMERESIQNNCSLWETVKHIVEKPEECFELKLSNKIKSALEEFFTLICNIQQLNREKVSPVVLYEKILHQSGYWEYLQAQKNYEAMARMENLQELLGAIKEYEENALNPSLEGFLEQIALDTTNDENRNEQMKGEVSLMTVHGAKGLEFHYVFIVGAEENVFPSYRSMEEGPSGIEEERRLFYVAMTRAMKKLSICFAQGRMLFGQVKFNGPSRFIDEIPDHFYSWKKLSQSQRLQALPKGKEKKQYKIKSNTSIYRRGRSIRHGIYGKGKVVSSEGYGQDEKIVIMFNDGSRKKFMVKYSPLELL